MKTVVIGLIGTGWAGNMHVDCYRKVYGANCKVKWVCSMDDTLEQFARKYNIERITRDYHEILADPEVDMVDIVTPPALHLDMIKHALAAGKHVFCEKPVTGFFEVEAGGADQVSKQLMLDKVREKFADLRSALKDSDRIFGYAENWLYAPAFVRLEQLVAAKRTTLLQIRGFTGHKGSHATHAGLWRMNGGGALIRQGCHPLSAALHLKRVEMESRGLDFGVEYVYCDAGRLSKAAKAGENNYIDASPSDVEDWSELIVSFTDGTKAVISSSDVLLGGIYNRLEAWGNNAYHVCNMTPNDLLESYFSDDKNIEQEHIMEKNDSNIGMHNTLVEEKLMRGYQGEIQDMIDCICNGGVPRAGIDIAELTMLVTYYAYLSAELGKRIAFHA